MDRISLHPCWELMIGSVYNDFGLAHNDQIVSGLVSTFPVILDTIVKYWIFPLFKSCISFTCNYFIIQ
ncbi:putative chloroplast envelope membrane protein, CemA [Dioscorea sansibarensis]